MNDALSLPAIPHALQWETPAVAHAVTAAGSLQMSAGPQTDHFVDPRGAVTVTNSVRLLFHPDEHFMLAARAQGGLVATYDAAVLMLYGDERHWAKLCLELSPQGQPMIVSVVTNGVSDDCNSVVLDQADAFLRVSGLGTAYAFHYSLDGQTWHFVRYFTLHEGANVRTGFSVQAPVGDGCTVDFSAISYVAALLGDLRSGE